MLFEEICHAITNAFIEIKEKSIFKEFRTLIKGYFIPLTFHIVIEYC